MVKLLSSFLKDLRKHLIPIYEIQIKRDKLKWTGECQNYFDYTKGLLVTALVLHMLTAINKFGVEAMQAKHTLERYFTSFSKVSGYLFGIIQTDYYRPFAEVSIF